MLSEESDEMLREEEERAIWEVVSLNIDFHSI